MLSVQVGADHELVIAERPAPVPEGDEAVIDVSASSVNRGELALIGTRDAGWTPGQDVAGVVARAAADGSGPEVGTRVAGLAEQGAWSDQVVVRANRLVVVPDSIALTDAAALPMAGLTALRTARLLGDLVGRRVLVTGASGGVGRLQVQLAALAGAEVIAVSRSGDVPGAHRTVADPEAADPVDAVLEGVGGTTLRSALAVLRPRGTVVLFGTSSGEATPLTIYDFIGREFARILTYFSYAADTTQDAADLHTLLGFVAAGRLDPGVVERIPRAEVTKATERLAAGGVGGKLVLVTEPA